MSIPEYLAMLNSGRELTLKEKHGIFLGSVIEYLEPKWKSVEVIMTSLAKKMPPYVIQAKELGTKSLPSELLA